MLLVICLLMIPVNTAYSFAKRITLLNTSQYHDVAFGSYLVMMFTKESIARAEYTDATITASLNISLSQSSLGNTFDFLSFSSSNNESLNQYYCYIAAVSLNPTISNCSITCSACDENCLSNCMQHLSDTCCCRACANPIPSYNLSIINNEDIHSEMSYPIMVIDNSMFLGNQETQSLGLLIDYWFDIDLSQEYEIMLYVVIGLAVLLLLVLIGVCIWLYRKVDHTNKEILLFQKGDTKEKDA